MSEQTGWVRDGTLMSPAGLEIDIRCGETWDNSITIKGPRAEEIVALVLALPKLVDALTELARCARAVNAKQHAGGPVHPEDWSLLCDAENAARAALREAGIA